MWKPLTVGARYPEEVRQWLYETYTKAKASDPASASVLLREITSATLTAQGDARQVRIDCTKAVTGVIDRYYAIRPKWKLSYRIPN